jgi:hypothetical protein
MSRSFLNSGTLIVNNYDSCTILYSVQKRGDWSTEYIFLLEMNMIIVSVHSAGAYTATLLVMVNVVKGGGRATPHPHQPGLILPS